MQRRLPQTRVRRWQPGDDAPADYMRLCVSVNNKFLTMRYASPGEQGSLIQLQKKYSNFINGELVMPVNVNYFTNTSPRRSTVLTREIAGGARVGGHGRQD